MKKILLACIFLICSLAAAARQPETGYRGFLDWNGEVAPDLVGAYYGSGNGTFYTGFTTAHGYQLKPWLFAGAGAGLVMWPKYQQVYTVPVFANCRFDLGQRLFSPFLDIRLGANAVHGAGIYLSATVGLRVNVYKTLAINVAIGYTMTGMREHYDYIIYDNYHLNHMGWVKNSLGHQYDNTLALRLGLEF